MLSDFESTKTYLAFENQYLIIQKKKIYLKWKRILVDKLLRRSSFRNNLIPI